jgi:hypothetical protein
MTRRRITRALGAAAGGLLGAAFLPAAVAFADNYEIVPDPNSTETVTGIYGLENTAPPAVTGSVQGYQEFEVYDTTTSQVVGTFYADESNSVDIAGDTNQELLVIPDPSGTVTTGTVGTAAGDTPPVGSLLDTYTYGDSGSSYVYSDLASATPGADVISDTDVTPFGDFAVPTTFDAAAGLAADSADTVLPPITLAGGYEIIPAANSPEQFTAIGGLPPYDVAVQGTQEFDVVNSEGAVVGNFDADVTTTSDTAATTTEAILVTSDGTGTVGTAAGDTPAVGSVFNTIDYHDGAYPAVYADLVSTTPGGANVISDTDLTPFGDIGIPTTFNAVADESDDAMIPFDGGDIAPGSTETLTGINGLAPIDVALQGTQQFEVFNSAGTVVGTFDADVTTTSSTVYSDTTETLLVTQDVSGAAGTAAGDVPAVGSVIDVATDGLGLETVYSDLASTTGAGVISDTIVTPFGDLAIPTTFDAASGLVADTIALLP